MQPSNPTSGNKLNIIITKKVHPKQHFHLSRSKETTQIVYKQRHDFEKILKHPLRNSGQINREFPITTDEA